MRLHVCNARHRPLCVRKDVVPLEEAQEAASSLPGLYQPAKHQTCPHLIKYKPSKVGAVMVPCNRAGPSMIPTSNAAPMQV